MIDDYEVGLHKTIEFCDLVISNEGRQGITKENAIKAKELKADYEKYLAGYKSLKKENTYTGKAKAFSR